MNKHLITSDELFWLNHIRRRVKTKDSKYYYRYGKRNHYEDVDIGDSNTLTDYTTILDQVMPFVSSRFFDLNNRMLDINAEIVSKLSKFLKYQPFSPKHMAPIKCDRPFPKRKVHYKPYPKMIADLPKFLAIVDGIRATKSKGKIKHSLLSINYGTKFGLPHAVVTGTTSRGYTPNLRKIEMNHIEPLRKIEPKEHFAIIARMLDMMGMKKEARLKFVIPSWSVLKETMSTYDTASGYVPWANGKIKPEVVLEGVTYINEPHRAKKKDLAGYAATYMLENFGDIVQLIERGEIPTKPFMGESFCTEEWKWQVMNALEAGNREAYESMHNKLRLFFIESANYTLLSIIMLKPIHKFLVGGPFGLSLSLNSGSFKALAREFLAQGNKKRPGYEIHLPRKDADLLDYLYDLYPELIERISIELDIKAFDQSLLYVILVAVALYYCAFYDYKDDLLCQILMADVAFRLCVKFLHMIGIDRAFIVIGMMFSGKFETSTGNTIYQVYVFVSYIHYKLKVFERHKKIHLLYIAWQYNLINFKFQGDDLAGAYPKVLREEFGMSYTDYMEWCEKYGLIVKQGYADKSIVGKSFFYSYNGVWEEDESKHVDGIIFLKNQMCQTFEDDKFVGILPYRSASDLLFRLGNSDKSSENIEGIYAKTLSIAMISVGNIESYEVCRRLYDIIVKKSKIDYSKVKEQAEKMSKGSNVLYQLSKEGNDYETFPSMEALRFRHDEEAVPQQKVLLPYATWSPHDMAY